ncbi:DUF4091 domain-containing protein [Candidatus Poribacteria bacterium]|nr:DUF4091 domain-containing protein [Candidatus Poribacteria bacterium]
MIRSGMVTVLISMAIYGLAFGQLRTARLKVIADNSIAAAGDEIHHNAGAKSVLRIKGIEHILIFKFDLSPIKGWKVHRAYLYLHAAHEHRLRTIGLSTIASNWQEGNGVDRAVDGGSCFTHAIYPYKRWAGEGSDLTDVTFGAGNTLYAFVDLKEIGGGWLEIDVPAKLISAMLCGASYGLAVSDEKGQTMWNNDIHSRETPFAPYLVVKGEPSKERTKPPAVKNLTARPDPDLSTLNSGAIRLTFDIPIPDGSQSFPFAYRLEIKGGQFEGWTQLPRRLIPFAALPGERQEITVPNLKPETAYELRLSVLDEVGSTSGPSIVKVTSSSSKSYPKPLPEVPLLPKPDPNPISSLFVVPDTVKPDPVTGKVMEDRRGNYDRLNPIWDGRTIRLAAARNETIAFQIVIRAKQVESVEIGDLRGKSGSILASNVRPYRVWCVREGNRWFPEIAVPIQVRFDDHVPNQEYRVIWVDLHVPKGIPADVYRGNIVALADGKRIDVPIYLRVWDFTLPDRPGFVVDLNGYGSVASRFGVRHNTPEGIAIEHAYHRLAYEHRATLNLLAYSHSGRTYEGWAPPIEGEGENAHVAEWRDYDAHYGALFDGSAFFGLTWGGLPIHHQYLPFHENYPIPIKGHYRYESMPGDYRDIIIRHAMEAPPVEEAFTPDYIAGFKAVVRDFVRHFREKGWRGVQMQCYFNNKYYYKDPRKGGRGTSWWLMDEPMHRDDWRALIFFGRMFKEAVRDAGGGVNFIFRCDVSRPQWVRDPDEFLPLVDLMCVSGEFFRKNRRCMEFHRRYGIRFWNYGTPNRVSETNLNGEAWAIKAFLFGADGILPWNTIGRDENFERAEPTALLYPGKRFGINGPLASLRLKALRRGEQDVEYLIALARRFGYDREQIAYEVARFLDLRARTEERFVDDAGRTVFESLRPEDFFKLRYAIGTILTPSAFHRH